MIDFDVIKKEYMSNKKEITLLESKLRILKSNNKIILNKLQKICDHEFVRECTTSGCYAEYHYICKKCDKWN